MDVRCGRCGAEYEFDDALVSSRGTTVKCTSCQFEFRVHAPAPTNAPERWTVHKASGRELIYMSLRDLQRAISAHQVGGDDLLARGNEEARAIRSIPELDALLDSLSTGVPRHKDTLSGITAAEAPPEPASAPTRPQNLPPAQDFASTMESAAPRVQAGGSLVNIPTRTPFPPAPVLDRPPDPLIPKVPPPPVIPDEDATRVEVPSRLENEVPTKPRNERPGPDPHAAPEILLSKIEALDSSELVSDVSAPSRSLRDLLTTDVAAPATVPDSNSPETQAPHTDADVAELDSNILDPTSSATNAAPPSEFENTLTAAGNQDVVGALKNRPAPAAGAPTPDLAPSADPPVTSLPPVEPKPQVARPIASAPTLVEVSAPITPTPSAVADGYHAEEHIYTDPRFTSMTPGSRRASSRFIVMVVMVGAIGLLVMTVGKAYLEGYRGKNKPSAVADDGRTETMLRAGRNLLADGDLEGAKAEFDKASVLAPKNPVVLGELAQLAVIRADQLWLKLRLISSGAAAARVDIQHALDKQVARANTAVQQVTAVAPDADVVLRVRVDSLRMSGQIAAARALVTPLAAKLSQPEAAYVLAMLDLAEDEPGWATVIDRLNNAAGAERGLGRARSALIYALVRDGRTADAESELEKLVTAQAAHLLLPGLRAFVSRGTPDGGASDPESEKDTEQAAAEAEVAEPADVTDPVAAAELAKAKTKKRGSGGGSLLTQAQEAKLSGEPAKAKSLYQRVLRSSPGSVEALVGMGDLSRNSGNTSAARGFYGRALAASPSHVAAMMGLADIKWNEGNRKGAVGLYKRVVGATGGAGSYGKRAARRIKQAAPAPPPDNTASPATTTVGGPSSPTVAEPVAPTAPTAPTAPQIDTSDLPGH
ncbi:MAG: zinc-ribbon domain-containing protein [Polyangiaceae bacterium]|nr:zinc-ribbon domain-containing protein [Polyangiaceae bacterium]